MLTLALWAITVTAVTAGISASGPEPPSASDFPCDQPVAELIANETHALVRLTHWSQLDGDGPPVAGRTVFTYATWIPQLGTQPLQWDPANPQYNPYTTNAYNPRRVAPGAQPLNLDTYMYQGTCSLAVAQGAGYPTVSALTRTPEGPTLGMSTTDLAAFTVQAAGCECAVAEALDGTDFVLAPRGGPCIQPNPAVPQYLTANPLTQPGWAIRQTVESGGNCSIKTEALFMATVQQLMAMPFVMGGQTSRDVIMAFTLTTVEVASASPAGAAVDMFESRVLQHPFQFTQRTASAASVSLRYYMLSAPMAIHVAGTESERINATSSRGVWSLHAYFMRDSPDADIAWIRPVMNSSEAITNCVSNFTYVRDVTEDVVHADTGYQAPIDPDNEWVFYDVDVICDITDQYTTDETQDVQLKPSLFQLYYALAFGDRIVTDEDDPPHATFYATFYARGVEYEYTAPMLSMAMGNIDGSHNSLSEAVQNNEHNLAAPGQTASKGDMYAIKIQLPNSFDRNAFEIRPALVVAVARQYPASNPGITSLPPGGGGLPGDWCDMDDTSDVLELMVLADDDDDGELSNTADASLVGPVLAAELAAAQGRDDTIKSTMFQGDVVGGSSAAEPSLTVVPDGKGGIAIPFMIGEAPSDLHLSFCALVRLENPMAPRPLQGWYPLYGTPAAATKDCAPGTGITTVIPPGSRVTFYMPLSPASTGGVACRGDQACVNTVSGGSRRKLLATKKPVQVTMFGVAAPSIKTTAYRPPPAPPVDPFAPPLAPPAPGIDAPPAPVTDRNAVLPPPPVARQPTSLIAILAALSGLGCCVCGLIAAARMRYIEEPFRGREFEATCVVDTQRKVGRKVRMSG
jgi:hypothetical protein